MPHLDIIHIDSVDRITFRRETMGEFCTEEIAAQLLEDFTESNGIEFILVAKLYLMQQFILSELSRRLQYGDDNV